MKTSNVLLAVAAGAAVGALLGILFAPEKGSETRKRIVDTGTDLKNNVQEKLSDASHKLSETYNSASDKLSETYNSIKERVSQKNGAPEKLAKA